MKAKNMESINDKQFCEYFTNKCKLSRNVAESLSEVLTKKFNFDTVAQLRLLTENPASIEAICAKIDALKIQKHMSCTSDLRALTKQQLCLLLHNSHNQYDFQPAIKNPKGSTLLALETKEHVMTLFKISELEAGAFLKYHVREWQMFGVENSLLVADNTEQQTAHPEQNSSIKVMHKFSLF